ncbi:unnamed protein product [Cuscuta epithymum]|uniref:Uncharacterized protein n=1 Tax=Cuscuta epithymum TaxID=186058 RepID=A0AAV0EIY3_9ASTE|nr:unnamed protein product [Cuscuta epithymum]
MLTSLVQLCPSRQEIKKEESQVFSFGRTRVYGYGIVYDFGYQNRTQRAFFVGVCVVLVDIGEPLGMVCRRKIVVTPFRSFIVFLSGILWTVYAVSYGRSGCFHSHYLWCWGDMWRGSARVLCMDGSE